MGKEFENSNNWYLAPVASLFFIWAAVALLRNHFWIAFALVGLLPGVISLMFFFGKIILAAYGKKYVWLFLIFPLWIAGVYYVLKPEFSYHTFFKNDMLRVRFDSEDIHAETPVRMEVAIKTENRCMITRVQVKSPRIENCGEFETHNQIPPLWHGSLSDRNYCMYRFNWIPPTGFDIKNAKVVVQYETVVTDGAYHQGRFPVGDFEVEADLSAKPL